MSNQDDGFISTSRLAKDLGIPVASVFDQLRQLGLIETNGDKTELTEAGKQRGGRYMSSQKYGTWMLRSTSSSGAWKTIPSTPIACA